MYYDPACCLECAVDIDCYTVLKAEVAAKYGWDDVYQGKPPSALWHKFISAVAVRKV